MRGSELLPIESLYALELALLRYPGLRLEAILRDAVLYHEDEETGEQRETFNAFLENKLVFRFRGPEFGDKGRPAALVLASALLIGEEADWFLSRYLEQAVESLERLVENHE